MKKRFFLIVAVLVLFIALLTLTASAADDPLASGSCGPNLSYVLGRDGVLTITGSGPMNYQFGGYGNRITTVVIGNGVTTISDDAFNGCFNMTSITIPGSVTRIGEYAFYQCTGLTSVDFPEGLSQIGACAFHSCTGLTSVTLPKSMTHLGSSCFNSCTAVTSLSINSDLNGSDSAFAYCSSLTALHIGPHVTKFYRNFLHSLNTLTTFTVDAGNSTFSAKNGLLLSKDGRELIYCPLSKSGTVVIPDGVITVKQDSFLNHDYITAITFPDSLTTIEEGAFVRLPKLASLTIPDSVTTIGILAFYDCKGLTSVTIGSGVTSIGSRAFERCSKLTSIVIPESVTELGAEAFRDCSKLKSVTLNNCGQDYGAAFSGCSKLTALHLGSKVAEINQNLLHSISALTTITVDPENSTYSAADGLLLSKDGGTVIFCPFGKSGSVVISDSITHIEAFAFSSCAKLKHAYIPVSVIKLGDFAFENSGLNSIRYGGTEEAWQNLLATGSNQIPDGVKVFFSSKPLPDIGALPKNQPSSSNSQSSVKPRSVQPKSGKLWVTGLSA